MIFDREASAEDRWKAFYELTTGNKAARRRARKILLGIALDATEAVEVREVALRSLALLGTARSTRPLLPLLLDTNTPWEVRAEVAHVLGMAGETRPFALRALMAAWKTAPPPVRFYIAYAFSHFRSQRPIALLRENINDDTPSHDLWWTLAQECRWAILCCRNAERDGASDPEDLAFLSPAWEQETQFFRAKGRRLFQRNCR